MRRGVRLKHLNRSGTWPSGNPRLYFRPKGEKGIALPDLPIDSPKFLKAYAAAADVYAAASAPQISEAKGSLGHAIVEYLGSSAHAKLSAASRARQRLHLEKMRERYGSKATLKDLLPRHIRKDLAQFESHAAANRLRTWRSFCKWAVRTGRIDTNPAVEVEQPELPKSDGFTAWTDADVAKFRAHWAIGTPQRLCFELLYRSCAAIGDACHLTRGHIQDGWLIFQRGKTNQLAVVPWAPERRPGWFGTDDLDACLKGHQHLTFIVTAYGKSRSENGATQWFSRACTEAGLPKLSAHGVRKYRAAYFKERGALPEQRMAVLGHATQFEAGRYAKSADLTRVITGTGVPSPISNLFQISDKTD